MIVGSIAAACGGDDGNAPSHASGGDGGVAGSAGGTGGTTGDASLACVPGQSVACAGPGQCPGFQVCRSDGEGFEPCDCLDGGTDGPAEADVASTGDAQADASDSEADGCACAPGVKLACVSACGSTGSVTCTSQCSIPSGCVPPAEICNGLDDDCVSGADNGFPCKQFEALPCTTTCGSSGSRICTATCSIPTACEPPSEVCNGLDDDCNGLADNSFSLSGTPLANPSGNDIRAPRVAYSGSVYAVAYLDFGSSTKAVRLQRYDASGSKQGTAVEVDGAAPGSPSIAWNGSVFGVVWGTDGAGIYFRAFDAAGVPQGPVAKIHNANAQSWIGLSAVGSDFLLAFGNYAPPTGNKFYSARITSAGVLVGGTANDITTASGRITQPMLVPSGTGFRVFWSDDRSGKYAIYSRALDSQGLPTAAEVGIPNGQKDASFWSATAVAGGFVLGYSSFEAPASSFLVRVDGGGAPTGTPAVVGPSSLNLPAVAWDGTRLAVLTGDEFQLRDSQLAVLAKFSFWTPGTNNPRYSSLFVSPGRVFGAASTATEAPQLRLFGDLGCDAP